MLRRIASIVLFISTLLLSVVFLSGSQVLALTTTPLPRTLTPTRTVTRTPTVVSCVAPTYFVTVTPSASSVNVGDQIIVSVHTNVGIANFTLSITDNATGLTQSQTDPIFTPAAPASQTPSGGTTTVQWTLTAVRAGSVTLKAGASGEIQACFGGSLGFTFGASAGQSGPVTVGTTPTLTPTPFVAGDLGYGTVSGKVTDATTGAAISGATVTCSHTSFTSPALCSGTRTTAADGTYSFANVFFHDTDQISVTTSATGYITQTITKSSFTTAGMTANFALAAATGNLPDLIITGISWSPSNPQLGQAVIFSATIKNNGTVASPAGVIHDVRFMIDSGLTGPISRMSRSYTQSIAPGGSALVQADTTWIPTIGTNYTITAMVDSEVRITESDESNNFSTASTLVILQPTPLPTTRTPTPTRTLTNTPTRTPTVTVIIPDPTPSQTTGGCSPVTSTITAPFTFDGAGTFCWKSSNLGTYINSWNTTSVTINGVNISNVYIPVASYPAKINGFWYVGYSSTVAWGHFEAK